jgi:lysophospholipid acyltransferase (LPLAT)-like uncharacterized protein
VSTIAPTEATQASLDERGVFTRRQRLALFLVSWLGHLAVRLISPTLRWKVMIEEGGPPSERFHPGIYVFWHRCVFPATYWYRNRGIAVMTSSSFDGEYIARIIERFGFPAVRGSTTRGGVRALLGMHKVIEQDHTVAFTIDGPRGPCYVAKPGPVLLARNTGVPIYCFHIAIEKAWVMKSWDRFMIPKPFAHALLRVGRLIHVPAELTSLEMRQYHDEMQATLDRTRDAAEQQMIAETGRNA